jgi:hypothetical protein
MEWVCRRCGRTHDEAPVDGCLACGHAAVDPAADGGEAGDGTDDVLARAHDRLFAPRSLELDLLDSDGILAVAFRLILAVSALFVAVAVVSSLL